MAKLLFLDLETTGTDKNRHGVIQIAGILEIDGVEQVRFDLFSSLFPGDIVNKEALKINGRSVEDIRKFPKPEKTYNDFMAILGKHINRYDKKDKFFIVGYNSRFDDDFLREWFRKCNDKFYGAYFFWPAIDVSNMAALHYMEEREIFKDFKLMTVAQAAGVDISGDKTHTAGYDVEITRKLFYTLKGQL